MTENSGKSCDHTIKASIFQGTDQAVFRSRREFCGSLLKQLREVYELIDLSNKTKATFSGLDRIDKRDYPEEAVREALLNCIVHRDYSFSGSTLIHIYDDRIEFVSLGRLVPGLSVDAIFMGVSQSRNPNLAAVFYRMRLIESYGTGISKILRLYQNEPHKPQFDTAKGVFRVILPNRNEGLEQAGKQAAVQALNEKEKLSLYVREHGSITRKEAENLLQSKQTKAYNLLKKLCKEGDIVQKGRGKNSIYIPASWNQNAILQ